MDNKEKSLELLKQIVSFAESIDLREKKRMIAENKASQTVGESWMIYHLKALQELVESIDDEGGKK